ncbi:mRNA cleavage and polyadenylation factor subunit [Gnomoniopsis smithogilvyi]|uniref:mRNA cleavage and polyadenylation factor subunit n=1 Tax=Gnomoniopsis smithogilvyi TaxID=1191159 RepID=A0A9W9D1F5_9PEZI|nr:mRNA cleavage and polyadenylation factor subunit [Gnomoniopsis smithogilvyi]
MQCYTELTPATAVTHSLSLPFLSAKANNLVVAKSSLLQIFETKSITSELDTSQSSTLHSSKPTVQYDSRINDDDGLESSFLGGDAAFQRSDRATHTKLVLVAELTVSGTVTGLARIKTQNTSSGGEALLVQFKDAKLSLLEWDPERFNVTTVSIHYYEQEEHQGSPWAPALNDCVNFLTADPGSRCAALKFGARNLAILPFKQADEEDIAMDDWDPELDGPRPVKQEDASTAVVNGTSNIEDTPYSPSFVLRLSILDPNLIYPVDLAFLYEYREPTFGILSSSLAPSAALGRKDHMTFMVFTLDLQQKASTTILSVGGLPGDLFKVVALPAPVGGALLVGANELIHIDQSGATNGVGVNPFTKSCTDFTLTDQSDLCLRLEDCTLDFVSLETSQMLLALADGRFAILDFLIDGRRVSALQVKLVTPENGGNIIPYRISSLSRVSKNALFAGSEDGDSVIFGWTRKLVQGTKKKSRLQESLEFEEFDEDDLDDEDDIYADDTTTQAAKGAAAAKGGELVFRIHDRLTSTAPVQDITYGKASSSDDPEEEQSLVGVRSDLQLVAAVGTGKAGSLAIMNREIQPKVVGRFEFPEARGLWTMNAQKPVSKPAQGEKGNTAVGDDYDLSAQHDKFMIVAKIDLDNYETSDVYALTAAGFESLTGTEFEPAAGFTVQAGTMANHRRVIQVLKSEVRVYDGDLGLDMILPMQDEETGAEPRVLHASICDPYLLLIRDDSSAFIAQMNSDDELEEVEKPEGVLTSTKWVSGCLYADTTGIFGQDKAEDGSKRFYMFLLSNSGSFQIFALPDLSKPVFATEGLCYIPSILTPEWIARRGTSKESVTEILIADLGDTVDKSPHMILRHTNDDLTIYEPRRNPKSASNDLVSSLFFRKVSNNHFARTIEEPAEEDDDATPELKMPLRVCDNIGGYSAVFLPGPSPSFVIKSAKSSPKVIGLQGAGVRTLSTFHTEGCEQGFIYADTDGIARVTQLPMGYTFSELGMSVRKVPLDADVNSVAFHAPSGTYIVGCNVEEEFELPKDEDSNPQQAAFWQKEKLPGNFKPMAERGSLRLVSQNKWTVIDEVELEPCEILMCVKSLSLEISESTKERRELIVVGTAISKGEDLPIRGRIHVYDLASVIPEPGRPETNKKFKLVAKEDIPRGGVTAISGIGNQGFVLVAHGQKCTVRGLKEDGSLLPVAFMDMSNYVTSLKEIPGTGLCVISDAFKGVWFTGYTEEPYKMMLFGKSNTRLEVLNADFLPDGKDLFIVAADADANLHVLQFDPEHPKSLQGHLLLHRTTFNVGANIPTRSLLLPRVPLPASRAQENGANPDTKPAQGALPPQTLLLSSPTGALATLSPLSETSYRRLSSLVSQLITTLPHHAGLNPKAYRMPPSATQTTAKMAPGIESGVGANIVDAAVLSRWNELASGRKGEIAGRVGFASPEEVRGELEGVLGWTALSYF